MLEIDAALKTLDVKFFISAWMYAIVLLQCRIVLCETDSYSIFWWLMNESFYIYLNTRQCAALRCSILYETWIVLGDGFSKCLTNYADFVLLCSIFENGPIPYPKREFLTGDENDDKMDTATSKVNDAITGFVNVYFFSFSE